MPSVYGRTRAQLRQSIGFNLGAIKTGTATGGTNNTLIDVNTFRGGDDTYNGKIVIVTDASDGTTQTTQYVNDYTASNNTIQFQQNASFTVASGDTYEIWDAIYIGAVPAFICSLTAMVLGSLITQQTNPPNPIRDVDGNDISNHRLFTWRVQ